MTTSKILFAAAAMAAMLVSTQSEAQTASAASPRIGTATNVPAHAYAATNPLSSETPYISGNDGSRWHVTVINNTTRDVWMTFYKDQWQHDGQAGTACVPPGKQVVFGKSIWGTTGGGDLRGELKAGANCGGSSLQDKTLAGATSSPIYSGGTARLVISNVGQNTNDFQGSFTP